MFSCSIFLLLFSDPHLQVNRLPPILYEIVFQSKDNYFVGGTLPGLPNPMLGSTKYVSFGATYGNIVNNFSLIIFFKLTL